MGKKVTGIRFKFLFLNRLNKIKSTTLVELMISIIALAIMVLSFYSLETFSHQQVMGTDRRAKVQNNLSYCLEHMSKYVQKASGRFAGGSSGRKAIEYYPDPLVPATATGFRVYVDLNAAQTPSVFTDDGYIDYTLSASPANTIVATCTGNGGVCPFTTDELSDKIVDGVAGNTILPDPIPDSVSDGFYIKIDSSGNYVDVGLVGRYDPTKIVSKGMNSSDIQEVNPQVGIKTRLFCNSSSTN